MEYKYKTVLLVDDSYIDNLISKKIMESNYYAENIIVMESSKQAIDFISESILSKQNIPQVLFLDIRMPGMNGFDFLEEFSKIEGLKEHNLKIYILSSSLDPTDYKKIQGNKLISKFIGKPLTPHILEEI
jgi:response regulator RpfG family c-di-GMP phosphodiesterase